MKRTNENQEEKEEEGEKGKNEEQKAEMQSPDTKKIRVTEKSEKAEVKLMQLSSLKKLDDFDPAFTDLVALPVNGIAEMVDLQAALGAAGLPPGGLRALTATSAAHSAALAGIPAALANLTAAIAALAPLPAAVANLQVTVTALAPLPAAVANLGVAIHRLQDDIALVNNRGARSLQHPLMSRIVPGGAPLPLAFPPRVNEFNTLSAANTAALLAAYGLPAPVAGETLPSRRRRLLEFLGVSLDHISQ
jgi:hypothetical protein